MTMFYRDRVALDTEAGVLCVGDITDKHEIRQFAMGRRTANLLTAGMSFGSIAAAATAAATASAPEVSVATQFFGAIPYAGFTGDGLCAVLALAPSGAAVGGTALNFGTAARTFTRTCLYLAVR